MASLVSRFKAGKDQKFSFIIFFSLAFVQLTIPFWAYRLVDSRILEREFAAGFWTIAALAACFKLFNCFFEFFFHRYLLHLKPFAFLERFAQQHRRHHGLTNIGPGPGKDGTALIRNRYPIVKAHQHEASFFPYFGLSFFFVIFTALLLPLKWFFPNAPVLTAGYLSVFFSYCFYEVWHAIEHLDFERWWKRKVEHRRWGRIWTHIYGFHQMHHANHRCNEAIGGFLGLPIADWLFGTFKPTRRLLLNGTLAADEDFSDPHPVGFIRSLDALAERREITLGKKRLEKEKRAREKGRAAREKHLV